MHRRSWYIAHAVQETHVISSGGVVQVLVRGLLTPCTFLDVPCPFPLSTILPPSHCVGEDVTGCMRCSSVRVHGPVESRCFIWPDRALAWTHVQMPRVVESL